MSFSPKNALLPCSCSALFLVLAVGAWGAANPAGQSASDNSKANKQSQPNADQQSNNSADLKMTQEIRRALMKDKSLSMYAHNVKVITENGKVTLRGPVRSETTTHHHRQRRNPDCRSGECVRRNDRGS